MPTRIDTKPLCDTILAENADVVVVSAYDYRIRGTLLGYRRDLAEAATRDLRREFIVSYEPLTERFFAVRYTLVTGKLEPIYWIILDPSGD